MVGRMPKRGKADQLANDFTAVELDSETPEQKRQRIAAAIQTTQNLVGDIQTGSRVTRQVANDDMVMRKAYRRAVTEGLTLNDLAAGLTSGPQLSMQDVMLPDVPLSGGRQMLTEEFPVNAADNMIMEEFYRPPAPQQRPQPQRQQLTEQSPLRTDGSGRKAEPTENWKMKRYLGETRSGKEIQVWRVENARTGTKLRSLFRIEGVASRITMLLNESGDANDPRVLSLVNAYEKRDKLLKEARQLEREAEAKPMKTDRLRQIRAEINQLEYRLGV